jgi:hypothetical protein
MEGGRDVYAYFKHEALGPLYAQRLDAAVRTSFRSPGHAAV